jgi:transposase-like protein
MTNPTRARRRFTAQQKAEAVELCLQEGLSCNVVAQRLGLPSSSLARWVRQAEVGAFYWTVLAPGIVNSGREEQGSVSV